MHARRVWFSRLEITVRLDLAAGSGQGVRTCFLRRTDWTVLTLGACGRVTAWGVE